MRALGHCSRPESVSWDALGEEEEGTDPKADERESGFAPISELRYSVLRSQLTSVFLRSPWPLGVEGRKPGVREDEVASPRRKRSSSCGGGALPGGGAISAAVPRGVSSEKTTAR